MIARPLPLILFSPLAVAWMILHWRAVRRVEVSRSFAAMLAAYHRISAAAEQARAALVEMTVAMIRVGQMTVTALRLQEDLAAVLDLSPLDLTRPATQTLRDAGIPSTFDPDRPIDDVDTDRL